MGDTWFDVKVGGGTLFGGEGLGGGDGKVECCSVASEGDVGADACVVDDAVDEEFWFVRAGDDESIGW